MLLGRVGDTPMPAAAITQALCSHSVHRHRRGYHQKDACEEGYEAVADKEDVRDAARGKPHPIPWEDPRGVIAITRRGCTITSNRPMAHYALVKQK